MFSIQILQLWLVMSWTSYVLSNDDEYGVDLTPSAETTVVAFMKLPLGDRILLDNVCKLPKSNDNNLCTMDISGFSQKQAQELFAKVRVFRPWLKCDNSALSVLDFSEMKELGHTNDIAVAKYPIDGNNDAFKIVNNLNLRTIEFGVLNPSGGTIAPGFFTIYNNPRLSRLSIDNINSLIDKIGGTAEDKLPENSDKYPMIRDRIKIQKYGECDYSAAGKSVTWEEFRWCRIIQHDVILTGDTFKPNLDTAYILHVNGALTIKNTEITDLSLLPVYFKIEVVISNNKLLCISFEDEIRMNRLGFTMINNMDLSCRTDCQGGELSLEQVKLLKDCVTLKGGLYLDGIDDATAAADLFKTVRTIHGPLVIKNARAIVDFKELKKIKDTGEEPQIKLENCKYPILFPNLTKLEGSGASPMVVLKDARIDILKFLIKTYPGQIKVSSKKVTAEATTRSSVTSQSTTSSSNKQPTIVTGSRGNRVDMQSTNAPVEQPVNGKQTEAPGATVTEVSTSDPSAAGKSELLNSSGDPNNSAVDGKKTSMFVVLTIVSFVVFFASSVTSFGIVIKYNVV